MPDLEILALLLAFGLFGLARWRHALQLALVLAVFEGAIRKWVLPDAQVYVYFFKDALLLGAYAAFFGGRINSRQRLFSSHPANPVLLLLLLLAILEVANPELPSPLVGLFGLKAYLMYVPLMYMVPEVLRDASALRAFWVRYLVLGLVPLLLGIVQFYTPADNVLNRYPWEEEGATGVAVFGLSNIVRITGTFSFITGYTSYLLLLVVFGTALAIGERARWPRYSIYAFLGLALTNLIMTGSRGPFILLGTALPILVFLAVRMGKGFLPRLALTLAISLPIVGLLLHAVFPVAGAAFIERAGQTEDVGGRVLAAFAGPIWAAGKAGFTGFGIGSTHQAVPFLVADAGSGVPDAEVEWERIMLEIGPLGFALVLVARILVIRRLWVALTASGAAAIRPFLAGAFLFCLLYLPGNIVFSHTDSVFYWFVAGFALIRAKPEISAAARDAHATPPRQVRSLARPRRFPVA